MMVEIRGGSVGLSLGYLNWQTMCNIRHFSIPYDVEYHAYLLRAVGCVNLQICPPKMTLGRNKPTAPIIYENRPSGYFADSLRNIYRI